MNLIATIACRNNSARLYAKPLQILQTKTVLDFLIFQLKERKEIKDIVLAISEAPGNEAFIDYAKQRDIPYILGDDTDVLKRLINACKKVGGDTVFRITSESPFPYLEGLPEAVETYDLKGSDYLCYAKLPDGCNFELISLSALEKSHANGEKKHRSELCTLYINENKDQFQIDVLNIDESLQRPSYRLTIDYPEDLILCRKIVNALGGDSAYIPYKNLIQFLDDNPKVRGIVENLENENYVRPYY
ncbi:MAG: acylneuraminate cytidylyltransferase [Bacteriovoracaceae bacterium]|nr:acylneuraminate cytidylyltransferase [Bacteriovoracaceae bacterium]